MGRGQVDRHIRRQGRGAWVDGGRQRGGDGTAEGAAGQRVESISAVFPFQTGLDFLYAHPGRLQAPDTQGEIQIRPFFPGRNRGLGAF